MGRVFNGINQCTISYGASKDFILVHTVQLKMVTAPHSSGRMVSSGISDVAIASVHPEKTRLLLMSIMIIIIIIIMNKSQEIMVCSGHQKPNAMKLRPEK